MIKFITLDDGYSPPKTVEMVRQLVEQDKVLCIFNTLGTPSNTAIHKYMNQKKVPQLFVATGASKWGKPKEFPWTMGYQPDYHTEAVIYAKHILANVKDPKIAVLMQNDDFGKDYATASRKAWARMPTSIVKLVTYEVTDPTVDWQIIQLKDSGANVFFNVATPKFAAQAIRKAAEIGWKPVQYLNNVSAPVTSTMKPAGFENVPGHHHRGLAQGSDRPPVGQRRRDEGVARMDGQVHARRQPGRRQLRLCLFGVVPDGADAEEVRRQPHAREPHEAGGQPPEAQGAGPAAGHHRQTSPTDFYPVQAVQLQRFKGESWELFGEVMAAESELRLPTQPSCDNLVGRPPPGGLLLRRFSTKLPRNLIREVSNGQAGVSFVGGVSALALLRVRLRRLRRRSTTTA